MAAAAGGVGGSHSCCFCLQKVHASTAQARSAAEAAAAASACRRRQPHLLELRRCLPHRTLHLRRHLSQHRHAGRGVGLVLQLELQGQGQRQRCGAGLGKRPSGCLDQADSGGPETERKPAAAGEAATQSLFQPARRRAAARPTSTSPSFSLSQAHSLCSAAACASSAAWARREGQAVDISWAATRHATVRPPARRLARQPADSQPGSQPAQPASPSHPAAPFAPSACAPARCLPAGGRPAPAPPHRAAHAPAPPATPLPAALRPMAALVWELVAAGEAQGSALSVLQHACPRQASTKASASYAHLPPAGATCAHHHHHTTTHPPTRQPTCEAWLAVAVLFSRWRWSGNPVKSSVP